MDITELENRIKDIVAQSIKLKNKYTDQINAPIGYVCIFAQSKDEYEELESTVKAIGRLISETKTGNLYQIPEMDTDSGRLKILKLRIPDVTRPELGDSDFNSNNYEEFKKEYLRKEGFKLIERENFEMIELMSSEFNVRVYFSNPPVEKQYKLI